MTVSMRRLTRDLRARAAKFDELPTREQIDPAFQQEIDRIRRLLIQLGVDVTDRAQARAVLALTDVFAKALDGTPVAFVGNGFAASLLQVVALTRAELDLALPGEDD